MKAKSESRSSSSATDRETLWMHRFQAAREWGRAREEIRRWVWGGGKKLLGLVLRRDAEAALL